MKSFVLLFIAISCSPLVFGDKNKGFSLYQNTDNTSSANKFSNTDSKENCKVSLERAMLLGRIELGD
jgi:hypothetical protein